MCDTWVAMPDATLENRVIFAKNSDRPVFDCQPLVLRPRQRWAAGSEIQMEYVRLPQVEETYAHLGSRPYWCWGYEEGMNEWGLAVGNEAVFTRPYREAVRAFQRGEAPPAGLLGMDLIRLALERCQTARQAVELIGALVEEWGQFGSGNPGLPHDAGSYDNAFIAADPAEAWVIETAGRRWAARRLRQGCAAISNELSIRQQWDLGSSDLADHAVRAGYWRREWGALDFARAYIDEQTARQVSHIRVMRARQLLAERGGQITPQWMMRIARDHYEDTFLQGPYFDAADPDFLSLCMHASPAGFTWGNTASSCVAVLPKSPGELPVLWWTPGPPCNGCYVPFFAHGGRLPEVVSRAGQLGGQIIPADRASADRFAPDSYWWLFRALNDWVKGGVEGGAPGCYPERNRQVRARFDELERSFAAQLPEVMQRAAAAGEQSPAERAAILDAFSEACVRQVLDALNALPGGASQAG